MAIAPAVSPRRTRTDPLAIALRARRLLTVFRGVSCSSKPTSDGITMRSPFSAVPVVSRTVDLPAETVGCVTGAGVDLDAGGSSNMAKSLCRSEERRVGKECRSRWSPYH